MTYPAEMVDDCAAESLHGPAAVVGFCRPCWNDLPGFVRLALASGDAQDIRTMTPFALGWLTGRNALRAKDKGQPAERGELAAMQTAGHMA